MIKILPTFSRRVSLVAPLAIWCLLAIPEMHKGLRSLLHISTTNSIALEFILGFLAILVVLILLNSNYSLARRQENASRDNIGNLKIALILFGIIAIIQVYIRSRMALDEEWVDFGLPGVFAVFELGLIIIGTILPTKVLSLGALVYYVYAENRIYKTVPIGPVQSEFVVSENTTIPAPQIESKQHGKKDLGVVYVVLAFPALFIAALSPMLVGGVRSPEGGASVVLAGLLAAPLVFLISGIFLLTVSRQEASVSRDRALNFFGYLPLLTFLLFVLFSLI